MSRLHWQCLIAAAYALGALPVGAAADDNRAGERAQVVVSVGNVAITVGDIEDRIAAEPKAVRKRYRDTAALRRLVEELTRFELLAEEAKRRGLDRSPTVLRAVSEHAVEELVRRDIDSTLERTPPSDADLGAYADAHKGRFEQPETRRASHILFKTRKDADELLPQIRSADVAAFQKLAREHSIDTETKLRGGDLRYFGLKDDPRIDGPAVDPAIVKAAFALKELGQTSEPIAVGALTSVVMLTGRRPPADLRDENVKRSVRDALLIERRQRELAKVVAHLRGRTVMEWHGELLDAVALDPIPLGKMQPGFAFDAQQQAASSKKKIK